MPWVGLWRSGNGSGGRWLPWQGRLPQELRLRGIGSLEAANEFLREEYLAEFNERFAVPAAQQGSAFVGSGRRELSWIFSIQQERTVNRDNTVVWGRRVLPIGKSRWRDTLAGCSVVVGELLDGTVVIRYGPHEVARWGPEELPEARERRPGSPRPSASHRRMA